MTEDPSAAGIAAQIASARETPSALETQWLRGATLAALTGRESARLRVGRYVLLRELGRGGQGTVWEAEDPRMRRPVALKFVQERFEHTQTLRTEAQAMAHLEHENIVEVFDVGEHEGRPYVVMERLQGESLAAYARRENSTSSLVRACVAAGRGLAAAHHAGVVHGDFKPSNVMVCEDGVVKVLDFGLARWSRRDDDTGRVGGTPAFMAPEQRRGLVADERSDQYSFCASLNDVFGNDASRIPRPVARALARGLQDDPADRWPSMDALLDALTPHRRRRAVLLAGGAAAGALLALGLATSTADEPACNKARAHRLKVWNGVRREALSTAFAAATTELPTPAIGVHTWARTSAALDEYTETWEQEFARRCDAADQGVRTCLLEQGRRLDALLDVWDTADAHAVELAASAVAMLPSPSRCSDEAESYSTELEGDGELQAELATIAALRDAGRKTEATERAEELLPRTASASASTRASALLMSGNLVRYSDPRTASERLEDATLLASAEGQDRLQAEAATSLAFVHGALLSDPDAAERSLKLADVALERLGGDRRLAASLDATRADIALVHGDAAAAVRTLESTWNRVDHPETPAGLKSTVLHNLARARLELGDAPSVQRAIAELQQVLELDGTTVDPSHPTNAVTYLSLGQAYVRAGEWELVKKTNTRALELANASVSPNHRVRAALLNNLALASMQSGDTVAGMDYFEQAYVIFETTLGREHPDTAMLAANLGSAALESGDLLAEIRWRTEALALFEGSFDAKHPKIAEATLLLGYTWLVRGDELLSLQKPDEARQAFERAASVGAPEVEAVVRERLATLAPPSRVIRTY